MSSLYQVVKILGVLENRDVPQYSSQWIVTRLDRTDTFIELDTDPKKLCQHLKDLGFLSTSDMRKISVSSMDKDLIEVRTKNDFKPLCRLEVARWRHH